MHALDGRTDRRMPTHRRGPFEITMRTRLLSIAGVLVFVSAAIHLALGLAGLLEVFSGGESALLPASYLLGGLAALALLGAIATDRIPPAATYAAGGGLMMLFLLAYADVHAVGVAESSLGIETGHDHGTGATADHTHGGDAGHSHGHGHGDGQEHGHSDGHGREHSHDDHGHGHAEDGVLTTLAESLRVDAYALVSKAAEAGAAVLFAVLLALDR